MTRPQTHLVRAAGGVPWRRRDGVVEVLLVHRPRYDDWTFPKGKVEDGESDEQCAVREVEEETGLRCRLGVELAFTSYTDSAGRPKHVRFWAMEPVAGEAKPQNEVDVIAWLTSEEAARQLTYDRDRDVLRSFVERVR